MLELVCDILEKGGVDLAKGNGKDKNLLNRLSLLESWLGISEASICDGNDAWNDSMQMMEDMGPFDAGFYKALENFLIEVWKPDDLPPQKFLTVRDLLDVEGDCDEDQRGAETETTISLHKSVLSIRVTRLLRFWMDLNVGGRDTETIVSSCENDDCTQTNTLSFQLLKNCSFDAKTIGTTDKAKKVKLFPLIQALYQYIEQLPLLQSRIQMYSQSLVKAETSKNMNLPERGLVDPQSRLAQLQMGQKVKARLEREFEDHLEDLECIMGEWYAMGSVEIRRQCRAQLGSIWSSFESRNSSTNSGSLSGAGMRSENTTSCGIPMTLRLLHRILLGINSTSACREHSVQTRAYEHVLFQHLIPMHRPNSMVLWRDQTCLLDLYHKPLVQCTAILLKLKPELIVKVIEGLLASDIWDRSAGNTPKLVLLLHEIDTYIDCLEGQPEDIEGSELGDSLPLLLRTLGSAMASENSRLAQRALPFVKNKKFLRFLEENLDLSFQILLPFLLRKEPSWNPTVRKMTYNVLKILMDFDPERFEAIGNRCFQDKQSAPSHSLTRNSKSNNPILPSRPRKANLPDDFSIKSAMGSWKPPTRNMSHGGLGATAMPPPSNRPSVNSEPPNSIGPGVHKDINPPLTLTGVAPWGMKGPQRLNPPLTVTGVAPWAMEGSQGAKKIPKKNAPIGRGVAPWASAKAFNGPASKSTKLGALTEVTGSRECEKNDVSAEPSRVLAYMRKIKPPEEKEGISSWSKIQMAESQTILSNLKFHDLVFGHELGEGAFGCVRYARLIDRTKTRSNWPEYAVKIISTEKIKEMGYESPLQRELAVLRMLSHPCIARMISSFRFREGVYLVLEYASGGDLHTLLKTNGSLDNDSTRFVMGEVTSALASMHEIGIGYFDLKPENIVVTESGHVKLTDFGGSRPITAAAKTMISESARNIFNQLRDGDWKPKEKKAKTFDLDEDDSADDDGFLQDYDPDADQRIEGTTIYLPPEVVSGALPNLSADAWALGCVLYQCLTGRPPILEVDESLAKQRIVSFDVNENRSSNENILFDEEHSRGVEESAKDLITKLLNRVATARPTMTEVAEHPFFRESGTDIFSLWTKPALKLEVGYSAPPPADAGWARRQLSSIWAPQPQAYDVFSNSQAPSTRVKHGNQSLPIIEGDEALFFFSKSNLLPSVRGTSGAVPLPPRKRED